MFCRSVTFLAEAFVTLVGPLKRAQDSVETNTGHLAILSRGTSFGPFGEHQLSGVRLVPA